MALNSTTTGIRVLPFQPATRSGFIGLTVAASVLFLAGFLSNGYVCFIIARRKYLWRRSHELMLFHLALADIITSTLGVFSQWHLFFNLFYNGVPTTPLVCKLEYFFNSFGLMASVYMILIFSIARYLTIVRSSTRMFSRRLAIRMVSLVWAFVIAASFPALFVYTGQSLSLDGKMAVRCYYVFRNEGGRYDVRVRVYLVSLAITVIVVPLIVIIFTYTKIICFISRWRRSTVRQSWSTSSVEVRALKIAFFIMITLVMCFAFFASGLVYNLAGFTSKVYGTTNEHILIAKLLASFNSCLNPWIYVILNQKRHRKVAER